MQEKHAKSFKSALGTVEKKNDRVRINSVLLNENKYLHAIRLTYVNHTIRDLAASIIL